MRKLSVCAQDAGSEAPRKTVAQVLRDQMSALTQNGNAAFLKEKLLFDQKKWEVDVQLGREKLNHEIEWRMQQEKSREKDRELEAKRLELEERRLQQQADRDEAQNRLLLALVQKLIPN